MINQGKQGQSGVCGPKGEQGQATRFSRESFRECLAAGLVSVGLTASAGGRPRSALVYVSGHHGFYILPAEWLDG